MNASNYTDYDAIEFNTIDEILYIGMQNDVSFLLFFVLSIWEHQSTFNPNVPIRMFLYAAQLYDKYMTEHNCYRYSKNLIKLPRPKCICFYNGTDDQPEEMLLNLSDAFKQNGRITKNLKISKKQLIKRWTKCQMILSSKNFY